MVAYIALPIAPHQVRQELTGVAQLAERMPQGRPHVAAKTLIVGDRQPEV